MLLLIIITSLLLYQMMTKMVITMTRLHVIASHGRIHRMRPASDLD